MTEFEVIEQIFKPCALKRSDVLLGIGDDAACVEVAPGNDLLVSTDTLVAGVHFLPQWQAYDIAYKSVMTNVSDMAAMAADPCWVTLALTLPEVDNSWLLSFAKGLGDALQEFNIALIGGDMTQGPLSITINILGLAPKGQAIKRQGAAPGDIILVSGELGAAALAVQRASWESPQSSDDIQLMKQLLYPKPRIDLKTMLRRYASSAIDISDGFSADLHHILVASQVGACIDQEAIPIHPLVLQLAQEQALELALSGGDDYELCFTVSPLVLDQLLNELRQADMTCYPVGVIEAESGLRIKTAAHHVIHLEPRGYSHFRNI